ncbi:hypothetical protein FIBSPDRAFT_750286 [Athelia psychrophila]|uniref:CENP-V/GFA domain-containing protein n=1 Tax=Athelia psychrophila TaxID=1759441 RepID=A0A166E409_9AGAM|nr:hypothetical protein FIBSPDRAFT_750286 [Fibularhizoctonia sp. CBS 109695]
MSTITPPTDSELVAYKANCHCSAVTLTVRLPPLSTLELSNCNCSICTRNGYIMVYPTPENVEYHTGADNLTEFRFASENGVHRLVTYSFATHKAAHKFCRSCGSSICVDRSGFGTIDYGMNVRMFKEIDLKGLKCTSFDGKNSL